MMVCKPNFRVVLIVIIWITLMLGVKSTDKIEKDTHPTHKKYNIPSYSILFPLVQRMVKKHHHVNVLYITSLIRKYLCPLPTTDTIPHDLDDRALIINLVLTPNQQFILVRDVLHQITVYDIETGLIVRQFPTWSRCGGTLLLADDQTLLLWDKLGHVNVFQFSPHDLTVFNDLQTWRSFSPPTDRLPETSPPAILNRVGERPQGTQTIHIYTVSADHQFLLAADMVVVYAWDLKSGNHHQNFYPKDHPDNAHSKPNINNAIRSVSFLALIGTTDRRWVIATREVNFTLDIIVWNFQTGRIVRQVTLYTDAFRQPDHFTSLLPDERGIVFRYEGSKFIIRNLPDMEKTLQFHTDTKLWPNSCVVGQRPDSDRYLICIGGKFKGIEFWACRPDFSHVERTHTIDPYPCESMRVVRGFTDGGRILITTLFKQSKEAFIEFWDTKAGKPYNGKKR